MGYDDRYGNEERGRGRDRDYGRDTGRDQSRGQGGGEDRGFFERAGEAVGSWFGGDDDGRDRDRQSQDRGYGRAPERSRSQGEDRYSGQNRGGGDDRYSGGGNASYGRAGGGTGGEGNQVGGGRYGAESTNPDATFGGVGVAPEFSDGPRFDRQDIGWTGSHGVHPVSSFYGDAQRDPMGVEGGGMGGGGMGGGGSARSRAILQQAEQHGGRGRIEPGEQAGRGQSGQQYGQQQRYGQQQSYGQQQGQQYGASGQAYAQGGGSTHDPHYSEWRRRQVEALDRDYHEYRTENAARFETEFGSFREKRGQQRQHMGRVTEHMEVVGSDGQHVGKVDKVADGRIILAKNDPNAGGHHHSIPCGWLETVDDKVTLNKSAEEAMKAWRDEETSRALNEDRNSGSDGPHMLERSFSGTYRDEDR